MDNKCSWIRVALALAALALMVEQAAGGRNWFRKKEATIEDRVARPKIELKAERIKKSEAFQYVPAEVFSPDKLNMLLGYSYRQIGFTYEPPRYNSEKSLNDASVMDLLAWTKNKNQPDTIIGKYSVQQLIDLNDVKECDVSEMAKLRKVNDELHEHYLEIRNNPMDERTRQLVFKQNYKPRSPNNPPLEFLKNDNLRGYCGKVLRDIEQDCIPQVFKELDATTAIDEQILDGFSKSVEAYIEAEEIKNMYNHNEVVKEVLEGSLQSEAVKTTCEDLAGALDYLFDKLPESKSVYRKHYELCKIVLS